MGIVLKSTRGHILGGYRVWGFRALGLDMRGCEPEKPGNSNTLYSQKGLGYDLRRTGLGGAFSSVVNIQT